MNDILRTLFRSIMLIIGLFIITKLLGKKQLSSLSFFEYIVGITVGDIAGTFINGSRVKLKGRDCQYDCLVVRPFSHFNRIIAEQSVPHDC